MTLQSSLSPSRFLSAVVLAAFPAALALQSSATAQSFDEALSRYKECIQRVPFRFHIEGRNGLARTGKPEVMPILAKDYKKPQSHPDASRYLLASMIGQHLDRTETVGAIRSLRQAHKKPGDAWLWANALRIEANRDDIEKVVTIATTDKSYIKRAAAIYAIGDVKSSKISSVILQNCVEFPRNAADRLVILGAMAGAIFKNKDRANDDTFRESLRAYASLLDDSVKLTPLAKLQIARHLHWTLNSTKAFENPEPWLRLLDRGDVKAARSGLKAVVKDSPDFDLAAIDLASMAK